MKIHKVRADVSRYQAFYYDGPDDSYPLDQLTFDGTPKLAHWLERPPPLFVLEPHLESGDFFGLAGSIVASERAVEAVGSMLEASGELLPLSWKGQALYVVNVLTTVDLLDPSASVWAEGAVTGARMLRKPAFHSHRLVETPLFKIPELRGSVLTMSEVKDPDDEFIHLVRQHALTGLRFEQIWPPAD